MKAKDGDLDMEKFKVVPASPSIGIGEDKVVGYLSDCFLTDRPDSHSCVAKSVWQHDTKTTRYFVKYNAMTGVMVDPDDDTNLARPGDWTSNGRFPFRPVTKTAFDLYLTFLKTKNQAYLRQAGREADIRGD